MKKIWFVERHEEFCVESLRNQNRLWKRRSKATKISVNGAVLQNLLTLVFPCILCLLLLCRGF